ncbi:MAG: hypothetical protein HOO06_01125 [Bdellovibrionaceae bacterium]|nr:hypothetical protein [Pseudobdellovibrionaceae bacterium]
MASKTVCYCFKYTEKMIQDSCRDYDNHKVLNEIKAKMKDPGCFCKTANPSGKCCLGDVKKVIAQFVRD